MSHMPRKTCEWCQKEYSHDRMRKHIKVCEQTPSTSSSSIPVKKLKPCPYCQREYAANHLSSHIKRVHQKEEPKEEDLLTCGECGKKGDKFFMNNHRRIHIRVKCSKCEKEYSQSGIKTHKCQPGTSSTNELKFKCSEPNCNYSGPTKGALYSHFMSHKPPVPCPHCAKIIIQNLGKHVERCKFVPSTSKAAANPPPAKRSR